MNNVLQNLKAARELISDIERWTRGDYARDASGKPVACLGDCAVCWCAIGALVKTTGIYGSEAIPLLQKQAHRLHGRATQDVNDCVGHAAVLEIYDAAIADAQAT